MALIAILGVGATLGLAASSDQTPTWLVVGLVVLLGVTLLGWNGLPHVLAPELAGAGAAGVAVGLVNSAGFIGVLVIPPIFGLIVDAAGAYRLAWTAVVVLLLGGLLALSLVYRAESAALRAHPGSPGH